MKHYFHFLFTGALLLGSLILFNSQKSECTNTVKEDRATEHIELQAKLPSRYAVESQVHINRHDTGIIPESIPNKLMKLESMKNASHRMHIRQKHIHLGLKPALDKQSGQYLHHRPSYDDPLTC